LSGGVGYGLVMGGGGARGFAHLGVIQAMRELGVPIDRLGGSSMGSIFAAGAAMYEDHDQLVAACTDQFDRLLDYTVPIVSLLKAKRITANLTASLGGYDIEDLWIPLYVVSTNLTRSRSEVHRRGDLVTAVRASIAIPGLLPPVPMGDDLLVDGGVLNNVPADIMRADPSIGTVIAIDVAPQHGPHTSENYGMYVSGWRALRKFVGHGRRGAGSTENSYPGVGSVLVRTMITGSERRRRAMQVDGTADLYLELEMDGVGLLEFDRMNHVMQRGYDAARPQLERWLDDRDRSEP
jgi:predicted acylesterase/phospholipase RssA